MICQDNVPLMPSSPVTQEKGSLCVSVCVCVCGKAGRLALSLHVFLLVWVCVYTHR